jgi:hypothetical protein
MLGATRAIEMVSLLAHVVSGFHSVRALIMAGEMGGAILVTLTIAASVLILAVAIAAAEVIRIRLQRYVQRYEQRSLPGKRDQGNQNQP